VGLVNSNNFATSAAVTKARAPLSAVLVLIPISFSSYTIPDRVNSVQEGRLKAKKVAELLPPHYPLHVSSHLELQQVSN